MAINNNYQTENQSCTKIVFSGGGTGGSVTPLLAVASELLLEDEKLELFFVGSSDGPEKELVANFTGKSLKFFTIKSGKWRRYFSLINFFDLFKIFIAFFQSWRILKQTKADLVVSAGSFVSVPLVWAAACQKIPILIHQQDIRPGLANKLMAPFARVVTISFAKSFNDYGPKAVWTGNPLRDVSVYQAEKNISRRRYSLEIDVPLLVVIGGGTGALALNKLVQESLEELLSFCQIVHFTGKDKQTEIKTSSVRYHAFEFLNQSEVLSLLATADLVVSRCGLGVLTELAALAKPAILIPIPKSHQEENAAVFADNKAAMVLEQDNLSAKVFSQAVKELLFDVSCRGVLINNISKIMKARAAETISALIWEILAGRKNYQK